MGDLYTHLPSSYWAPVEPQPLGERSVWLFFIFFYFSFTILSTSKILRIFGMLFV